MPVKPQLASGRQRRSDINNNEADTSDDDNKSEASNENSDKSNGNDSTDSPDSTNKASIDDKDKDDENSYKDEDDNSDNDDNSSSNEQGIENNTISNEDEGEKASNDNLDPPRTPEHKGKLYFVVYTLSTCIQIMVGIFLNSLIIILIKIRCDNAKSPYPT